MAAFGLTNSMPVFSSSASFLSVLLRFSYCYRRCETILAEVFLVEVPLRTLLG